MTLESDLSRIEAALAAGPTPGPWNHSFPTINGVPLRTVDCQVRHNGVLVASVSHGDIYPAEPFGSRQRETNAAHIASCHPDAIQRLIRVARLFDQILGALRLSAVIVPPGPDRTIIAAAIDALVAVKGQS